MNTDDKPQPTRPRSLKLVLGSAATVIVLATGGGAAVGAVSDGDSGPDGRFPGGLHPGIPGGEVPDPAA